MFALSACNPTSYFMLYEYSSSEKEDSLADKRMTELEQEREKRMLSNPNYRPEERAAYQRQRGIQSQTESTIDTRPISTQELRERLEREAAESNRR